MTTFLSIDCGTQSLRALLFDTKGDLIDKVQIFYKPYLSPKPGYAEQDPNIYWQSLCEATQKLKAKRPMEFKNVVGMSVTTLRATMVNVDKNGKILRPSILWLDQRKADLFFKPDFFTNILLRTLGVKTIIDKLQRDGKSNWIRQNEPDIWEKTYKYLQVSGYLNFKLTGEYRDSIASQIGHIPFDYKSLNWANPKKPFVFSAKVFPIEKDKLPELVRPAEIIGKINLSASKATGLPLGLPLIASGSDKGCETLGMGVVDSSIASLSFGTTATVQTTVKKYMEPLPFIPSYPSVISNHWNPEIEIFRGFWLISWFKNEFACKEVQKANELGIEPEELLDEFLQKTNPGAMGLLVQPYWTPGIAEKNAKGAIIGFGDVHKKEHIYRAVIEGLAYALREGMEKLQKRGKFKFAKLTVSGGASKSNDICQIAADVFKLPVLRGKTYETSGLGAAIVTAVGTKIFKNTNEAVENMVHYENIFEPIKENSDLYDKLYNDVYLKIYKKLEILNKRIREITRYPEI